MNAMTKISRLFLATVIGLAIGWLGNRYFRPAVSLPPEVTGAEYLGTHSTTLGIKRNTIINTRDLQRSLAALETASISEIRTFLDSLRTGGGSQKISRAFSRAPQDGVTPKARALIAVALRRWFARDPGDAWRYAQERASGGSVYWIQAAVFAWAERDPESAAAAIAHVDFPQAWRNDAEGQLVDRLLEDQPELALQLSQKHKFGSHRTHRNIFARLAGNDPERAADLAAALPAVPSTPREWAIGAVAQEWARSDGAAALQWLSEVLPASSDQDRATVGWAWAEVAPEKVIQCLDDFALDSRARGQLLGYALATWAEYDVEAVEAWLQSSELEGDEATAAQSQLIRILARKNPSAAASFEADMAMSEQLSASGEIGRNWAKHDPEAALAWAWTLPKSRDRDNAFLSAFAELAQTDPVRVIEELPEIAHQNFTDESPRHDMISQEIVRALSIRGPTV
ncbi:MAG: hypothetical protein ACI8T1_004479 [Verrucomicrobiales bacterium]|jgi:hypothetical protein